MWMCLKMGWNMLYTANRKCHERMGGNENSPYRILGHPGTRCEHPVSIVLPCFTIRKSAKDGGFNGKIIQYIPI